LAQSARCPFGDCRAPVGQIASAPCQMREDLPFARQALPLPLRPAIGMTAPNPPAEARPQWSDARRIVVKIGSSLLVDRRLGELNAAWLASLAEDVAGLAGGGKQVILVSSGAIALGRHMLGLPRGALELEKSQAAAAVGQVSLA